MGRWFSEKKNRLRPVRFRGYGGNIRDISHKVSHRSGKYPDFTAFDIIKSPVIILDASDRIIHINPEAERKTGYSSDFLQDIPVFSVLTLPEDHQLIEDADHTSKGDHGTEKSAVPLLTFHPVDHKSYTLLRWSSVRLLRKKDKSLRFRVLTGEDITHMRSSQIEERKFLSLIKSEEMFRTMLDNIQDAVLVLDGFEIIYGNHTLEELTGFSLDSLYRMDIASLLFGSHSTALMRRYKIHLKNSSQSIEARISYRNGNRSIARYIHIRGEFTYLRGRKVLVLQVSDVTKQKMNERELRKMRWQLKDTVERLTVTNRALADSHIRMEELSNTDQLTGLPNRRIFEEFLEHEWKRSLRTRSPISALLIDIDFFKQYNDHYGHEQGDQCLKHVAAVLNKGIGRTADLLSRFGGEEFIVVLPETNPDGAVIVGNRLIEALNRSNYPHVKSQMGIVTVSIGAATCIAEPGEESHTIVKLADMALYRAKEQGRNRVVSIHLNEKP
jgi:diguanylate cyclase (GGDEF)-like protein/PAS domain S-box-containing protein